MHRNRAPARERGGDVAPAFAPRQLALPGRAARSHEERPAVELPGVGELPGELLSSVIATLEAAVGIRRDEGDDAALRPGDRIDDDLLAIAGDNLFDYSLRAYVEFWRSKGDASCVAVHDVGDRELAKQYGIVDVDRDGRITSFVEKPENPPTTLCATATYLYRREDAALIGTYLAEGNPPDQPGHYVGWLYTRAPMYAYRFPGEWYDIGDAAQLLEADNRMRRRHGLPERAEYSPS